MSLPALLSVLLLSGTAPVIAATENQTLESFADTHKSCHQWTDGCAICLRKSDGTPACSLPGIACEPNRLACQDAAGTR